MKKKFVKTFRVDDKGNKRLEALMKKLDMNLSDTINKLIVDGIKYTQSKEKSRKKQKKEKEIKCLSLVYLEGIGYHCAENPSKPKKLGNGSIEHANTLCNTHKARARAVVPSKCEYIRYLEISGKEFISEIELMRKKKKLRNK